MTVDAVVPQLFQDAITITWIVVRCKNLFESENNLSGEIELIINGSYSPTVQTVVYKKQKPTSVG